MPGPCSAPNGDRSLINGDRTFCPKHGDKHADCRKAKCKREYVSKREYLWRINKLHTGKTASR